MRRRYWWIFVSLSILALPAVAAAEECEELHIEAPSGADHDITFEFADPVRCGQFANGDWWVAPADHGVVVASISPEAAPGRHGWEVNPESISEQPFDDRISTYREERRPELPYEASPGESLVKAVSVSDDDEDCRPCLQFAAVVTVVADPVPETRLRPPYFGTEKPLFDVDNLVLDRMPRLDADCCDPSEVSSVARRFRHVQLDHKTNWTGRHMHPIDNLPDYGASIARDNATGILRLMLDDVDYDDPDHLQALINYVQMGVDFFGMVQGGMEWPGNGGHSNGRKLPVLVAGLLLGDPVIQEAAGTDVYSENHQIFFSPAANDGEGLALFGQDCGESGYWQRIRQGSGSRTCADPYGYIDGGGEEIGGAYQNCCTINPWKYTSLAVMLLRGEDLWDQPEFFEYVDRYVTEGTWAQPDPCAPYDGDPDNYGVTYGPDPETDTCIQGEGRFTDRHAGMPGSGYGSGFGDEMWEVFRPCLPDCPGQPVLDDPEPDPQDPEDPDDAGVADAGSTADTGVPGDSDGPVDPGQDDPESGCACAASGAPPAGGLTLFVLLVGALGILRLRSNS